MLVVELVNFHVHVHVRVCVRVRMWTPTALEADSDM